MSLVPPEKSASNTLSPGSAPNSAAPSARKPRSCVICRTRKVRCDKQSPCSNCKRAGITCVLPSADKPPRWARRLEQKGIINGVTSSSTLAIPPEALERIRNLEDLVKDLTRQLEQAKAAGGSSGVHSPESTGLDSNYQREASSETDASNLQKPFGRLVLQDANRSRYVSSGFWSRVNDELDGVDSDTSEDEASAERSTTQELGRTPSERHGFLFGHNLNSTASDLQDFHPLPSQIPFLIDIFSENVNNIIRIVHIPTTTKMIRESRSNDTPLSPANEALVFSIYYAAVTSMEEEDIMTNFGCAKTDLNLKFRLGLEHALAKADFLNVPDLVLLQAFSIFLCLVRRHDSPRFVWMMTGLAIRMGLALGLQRDGSHFEHLTPYEVEMRRRTWAALCMLDVRASEDQGTDFTIARGSYDTKHPLNLNDEDISPETKDTPPERKGLTAMSYVLVQFEITDIAKQLVTNTTKGNVDMDEQRRLLNQIAEKTEQGYLRYSVEEGNITHWVGAVITRLVTAKLTLLIYLPILFSSPSENFSDQVKTNLLIAAIEIAEYNHALNAEPGCRHWRWVYQTYTHWYAVVYLLIEVSRRPWSPIVERAWVALHSPWLIPAQSHMDKNQRIWIPLKKLTNKAKKHRDAELNRLRNDPQAARQLEMEDQNIATPGSPAHFPAGSDPAAIFREQWRQLVGLNGTLHDAQFATSGLEVNVTSPSVHSTYSQGTWPTPYNNATPSQFSTITQSEYGRIPPSQTMSSNSSTLQPSIVNTSHNFASLPPSSDESTYGLVAPMSSDWFTGPSFVPWLWADTDPSVNVFGNVDLNTVDIGSDMDLSGSEVDWYNWVESAKGMELDAP